MKINFVKNTKRNLFWGIMNRGVAIICPFITRTMLRFVLGEDYLGLNGLFQSILLVLSLAELGFGSAIVYSMYKPVAEDNTLLVNALLNFYRKVYIMIGIVILSLGLLLIPVLPYLIKGSYPSDIRLSFIYLIFLLNTVVSYFMYAYKSSLIVVYQRDDINSRINIIFTILLMVAQIYSIKQFHSYYLFVIMMPVITILNNIRIAIVVKRMFPQYYCMGTIPKDMLNELKKQIYGTFVFRACQVARNSFDSICISAFLGLTMNAKYTNYYYIISALTSFLLIFSSSITGGVGNHCVIKSKQENFNELKEIDFVYMWISGWCTICMLCLIQPFMEIWMGKEMMLSNQCVFLFCIYFYLLKIGDIRGIYSTVNGLWYQNRWRSICEAILNIILNVLLAKYFGVFGIILATVLTLLFIHTIWSSTIVFKYYFGLRYIKSYFGYHIIYACVTGMLCLIMWRICGRLMIDNTYATLICRFIMCIFLPNIVYIILYSRLPYLNKLKQYLLR